MWNEWEVCMNASFIELRSNRVLLIVRFAAAELWYGGYSLRIDERECINYPVARANEGFNTVTECVYHYVNNAIYYLHEKNDLHQFCQDDYAELYKFTSVL